MIKTDNCQVCAREYLSNDLIKIEAGDYFKNLKACPSCLALYKVVQNFQKAANLIVQTFDPKNK